MSATSTNETYLIFRLELEKNTISFSDVVKVVEDIMLSARNISQ